MPEFANPEVYQAVLEELLTGVYLVDCEQKVRFWNSGAERITGYLRHEMVGRPLPKDILSTPIAAEMIACGENSLLVSAMREAKPIQIDAYLRHKKGHSIPVLLRAIPVRNAQDKVIGAAACFDENAAASEWNRRRDKLAEFGCLDDDTGIPNQEFVLTRLRECQDAFERHHVPFGVFRIDVNQMDHLRDAYGQHAASKMLRVVAQTLEISLRPSDCLGRWGENQFLAVLTECSSIEFEKVGERLRKMVSRSETDWWGDKVSVTVSLSGTAVWPGDSVESLLERIQESSPENSKDGTGCMIATQDMV
jgi:diguanylate cyclase (GGDEF)-like protein/PAS domain S-box-containing protein